MKRRWIQSLLVLLLMLIVARATYPCGYDYSFRDYLDKRFWQPFAEYEKAMGLQPGRRGGGDESGGGAFAGMTAGGTPALERLREAYRAGDYAAAGQLVAPALAASDQQKEREEILVLSGKVAMREGERGDDKALGGPRALLPPTWESPAIPRWRAKRAAGWRESTFYREDSRPRPNSISMRRSAPTRSSAARPCPPRCACSTPTTAAGRGSAITWRSISTPRGTPSSP